MSKGSNKKKLTIEIDEILYEKLSCALEENSHSLDDYIADLLHEKLKNRYIYEMNNSACSHPECPYQEHVSKVRIRRQM